MSGRCSPTEALNLLRRAYSPMDSAKRLTDAIHDENVCRLWCDGVLVKPHIAAIAQVVPELAEDGWTADIESTGPGLGWARGRSWELEIAKVMALLPQPELEKPWPTVSGSVNWSPPAMLAKSESEPRKVKRRRRKRRRKPEPEKATPPEAKPPEPPPPVPEQPSKPKHPIARRLLAQEACRQFAAKKYPDGHAHIKLHVIMHAASIDKEFRKTVIPFPKRDVWSRALLRRKS